jgi:hypothetical protein
MPRVYVYIHKRKPNLLHYHYILSQCVHLPVVSVSWIWRYKMVFFKEWAIISQCNRSRHLSEYLWTIITCVSFLPSFFVYHTWYNANWEVFVSYGILTWFVWATKVWLFPPVIGSRCSNVSSVAVNPAFRCGVCSRLFRHKKSCQLHMAMHMGETTCHICSLVLSRIGNMKRHLRHIHGIGMHAERV